MASFRTAWWGRFLFILILLSGCRAPPSPPSPSLTETRTPEPSHTPSPVPSPAPTVRIRFGEPVWIGRGGLRAARFTPDAQSLILGWSVGVSRVHIPDLREEWFAPLPAPLRAMGIDPRGRWAAAVLESGAVVRLSLADGSARFLTPLAPNAQWCGLDWSPDGEWTAVQCIGPYRGDPITLIHWETGTVREVPDSRISPSILPSPYWSGDGRGVLLAALQPPCPRFLDVQSGAVRWALRVGEQCLSAWTLAWSPDGRQLAVPASQGVLLLDGSSGQVVARLRGDPVSGFPALDVPREALFYDASGERLAALGSHGLGSGAPPPPMPTQVWALGSGRRLGARPVGPGDPEPLAGAFADDTLRILYEDGILTAWRYAQGAEETLGRLSTEDGMPPLMMSLDGRYVAANLRHGGAAIWAVAPSATPVRRLNPPWRHPVLSPDGALVLVANPEEDISHLLELETGQLRRVLPGGRRGPQGAAFSADGRMLAYGDGARVRVVRLPEGTEEAVLEGFPSGQEIHLVVWAPDGQALAAASGVASGSSSLEPGLIQIWRRGSEGRWEPVGRSVSVRTTYARPLIAFSPDGERVAVEEMPSLEAGASAVRVIDRRSGAETLRLAEHELVGWLDARRLVTVLPGTSELSIRDVETRERSSRRFPRTGSEVFDLSRMLIVQTSGARGEPDIGRAVEVIDGRTGERLAHLHHGSDIAEILWSPDGRWLLLLGSDGALRAWPVIEPAGRPGG